MTSLWYPDFDLTDQDVELLCNHSGSQIGGFRKLIENSDFQAKVQSMNSEHGDVLSILINARPEVYRVIDSKDLAKKLLIDILPKFLHAAGNAFEEEILFHKIRILALKVEICRDILDELKTLIVELSSSTDRFLCVVKLIAVFPTKKLFKFVLLDQVDICHFWSNYFMLFFKSPDSAVKKLLLYVLASIINSSVDGKERSEWKLVHAGYDECQTFLNLALSLHQCAISTVEEHVYEVRNFICLCNNAEISIPWILMLTGIMMEHHSPTVLRHSLALFASLHWCKVVDFLSEEDWKVVSVFICRPFLSLVSKQFVFETSSAPAQLIPPLEVILTRNQSVFQNSWNQVMMYSGNFLTKLLFLRVFAKCGLRGLKMDSESAVLSLRKCMASFSCVSEPLRSALLTASLFCGLLINDWKNCSFSNFYRFLTLFKNFNFDICRSIAYFRETILSVAHFSIENGANDILVSFDGNGFYEELWHYNLKKALVQHLADNNFSAFGFVGSAIDFKGFEIAINDTGELDEICNYLLNFCSNCLSEDDYCAFDNFVERLSRSLISEILIELSSSEHPKTTVVTLILLKHLDLSTMIKPQDVDIFLKVVAETISCVFDKTSRNAGRISVENQRLVIFHWQALARLAGLLNSIEDMQFKRVFEEFSKTDFVELALDLLESASMDLVHAIFDVMPNCATVYNDAALFDAVCETATSNCVMHSRKETGSDGFGRVFDSYVRMVFNLKTLNDDRFSESVSRSAVDVLNNSRPSISIQFSNSIARLLLDCIAQTSFSMSKFFELHQNWFVQMATGYSLKLGYETVVPVLCDREFQSITDLIRDTLHKFTSLETPRLNILLIMQRFAEACGSLDNKSVVYLVNCFLNFDSSLVAAVNRRQHVNSFVYHQRLRTWSCICKVLMSMTVELSDSLANELKMTILDCIKNDYSDPSLRVFMEISLAFIMPKKWDEDVIENLHLFSSSFVCSVTHAIGFKYLFTLEVDENGGIGYEDDFLKMLQFFSNWSTVSHNNIRISAQAFLIRLIERLSAFLLADSFQPMKSLVSFWKSHEKLLQTIEKNSHVMIYYEDLFKVSQVSNKINCYSGFFEDVYQSVIERYAVQDTIEGLSNCGTKSDNVSYALGNMKLEKKVSSTTQLKPTSEIDLEAFFTNEFKMLDFKIHSDVSEVKRPGSLVVIASLLDKMTNIGGLSRTGEVQGIEKLVVNSVKACEMSADFTSLSVTSSKWLPIEEVKSFELKMYINQLQTAGYSIVALEQSSKSESLQSFQFPQKCAVLLGNEKTGVPGDLLEYCDVHLEIPQVGVIRSLNVHVAASLLIWEYSKQHVHAS